MTQADEKELVLGNKQLISLFFVVAALCGVFFAMGYMIGRNSAKATLVASPDAPPVSTPVPRQQPEPPRETAAAPDPATAAPTDPTQTPAVDTRPAQDTAALTPAASPASSPKDVFKDTKIVKAPANAIEVAVPEPGATYLQVTALPRSDADNMVRTLREQNFPVILADSSKDGFYRVLVGPYRQTSQVADAKNRLKSLGFADAFVQKK